MKTFTFLSVFEAADEGGFSIYFPDVPGCISYGNSIENAYQMAQEALELHLYSMQEDGEEIPESIMKAPENLDKNNLLVPITVAPELVKDKITNVREKTTVTIPKWLKMKAEKQEINLSRTLEAALKELLNIKTA